jgi:hypothetical protein
MELTASTNRECAASAALVARSAHSVEQKKRNLRQTVRGSMRRMHVKTGMLNKRALYLQMLVYIYIVHLVATVASRGVHIPLTE